jgi:transposase
VTGGFCFWGEDEARLGQHLGQHRRDRARLGLPEPWQGTLEASLRLIDELDREIGDGERELRQLGADHRYLPLLLTVPGISWVLAYTIAAEIGDISRFASPRKLAGDSGLSPRVYQSGQRDLRGPLAKQGPRYLRWTLVEAATHACTAPIYRDRYQQSDLAHAHPQPTLRSSRRHRPPGRLTAPKEMRHRSELQSAFSSHQEATER